MKSIVTRGLICLRNELNIEFVVCKIEHTLFEDESFKYVFTPYYDVIDLLDAPLFQGIPGLDLDLRREKYIRENRIPTFISERVPSPNREDLYELLEKVGLKYINPIQYLINTDMMYSGDNFYVIAYEDRKTISIEEVEKKSNSLGIIRIILNNLARGNNFLLNNELIENKKDIFNTLLYIYKKSYYVNLKKRLDSIDNAKENGKYRGRKPINVDKLLFLELQKYVKSKQMTAKEAAKRLNISIDKYYRYKKELENDENM